MKKNLLLTIFAFCFITLGFSQADCATALMLTPGTPQAGDSTGQPGDFDADGAVTLNPCNANYNDDEYWFEYTATATGEALQLDMTNITNGWSGIFVMDNCPTAAPNCVAEATENGTADYSVTTPALTGGTSYKIVVTNWGTPDNTAFTLSSTVIAPPACLDPTTLTATGITDSAADLGWTETGTAALWNVELVDAGVAATGTATATGVTNPYTAMGLAQNSDFEFYVQADCGMTDGVSEWVGPFAFSTLASSAPDCPVVTGMPDAACGNFDSNLSWAAVPATDSYAVSVGTTSGGIDIADNVDVGTALTYDFAGTPSTTYFYTVNAVNSAGASIGCTEASLTTEAGLCYCDPSSTNTNTTTFIDNVSTTGASMDLSNLASGLSANHYVDNFATMGVTSFADGAFDFTVEIQGGTIGLAIWVDWNGDSNYEVSENVFTTTSYGNGPFTGAIAVPTGTANGDYHMRIMADWNDSNPGDDDACSLGAGRGETEDYKVTVVDAPVDEMDFNNVQWVTDGTNGSDTSVTVEANTAVTVYAQGYEAGVTEPAGAGAGVECWIAINNENTDPSTWDEAVWQVATYGSDQGNNDEYEYSTSSTAPGTNYVAARWRLNSATFTYGGFNGTWDGTTNVNIELIVNPLANDDCAGAIALTPGAIYGDNPVDGSVLGATADTVGAICGSDGPGVWYSIVVPASGDITIETGDDSLGGTGFDSVIEAFSGTCGALTSIDCNDDGGSGAYSLFELTGLTGGETIYVRVWEFGGNETEPFSISAYSASLSIDDVENETAFSYYPNPVKNTLTLSAQNTIEQVAMYNMLGQEVLRATPNTVDSDLDMSNLQTGTYFVKVTIGNVTKTIRVIKQ